MELTENLVVHEDLSRRLAFTITFFVMGILISIIVLTLAGLLTRTITFADARGVLPRAIPGLLIMLGFCLFHLRLRKWI